MSQFEVLECKETGNKKFYALKVEIETDRSGKLEAEVVHCFVCESYEISSGQTHWSIVSTEPEDLKEAVWDALFEKALESEITSAMVDFQRG